MKKSILSVALFLLASSPAFSMFRADIIFGYPTSHGSTDGGGGSGGGGGGGTPGAGPYDNPAQGPSAPGGYGGNYGSGASHSSGVNTDNSGNITGYRIGPKYGTRIPNDWKPKGKRTPIPPRDVVGGRGGYAIPTEEQKKWMDEDDARIKKENDELDEIEYKYETLMQADKDQLPEMKALSEQSEAIIIQRAQASESKETTFERLRRKALVRAAAQRNAGGPQPPVTPVQANALEVEQNVNQLTNEARETLAQPHVTAQLEIEAARYVNDQLDFSDRLAHLGDVMANENASPSTIELVGAVASDIARSTGEFLVGVNEGAQNAIIGTAQAMRAIYNDPALITHLSTNIMNTITAGPGALVHAAWNGLNHVGDAVYNFEVAMAYGTPEQRGAALGEFGGNVLLGIAGGEASVAARGAVEGIAGAVTQAGAADALGTAVNQGIRASEALAPSVVETNRMIQEARDAVRRNLEVCREVRIGYVQEVGDIAQTAQRMLAEGQSEEIVARHVHALRREIGVKYKAMTPEEVRPYVYQRNLQLPGYDELGPTLEGFRERGKSWKNIIDSSSKPNASILDAILNEG